MAKYGIALDIGTTTIASALVDAVDNNPLGYITLPNPQIKWGADVISRINAVKENPELLKELNGGVIGALNEIIARYCAQFNIAVSGIKEFSVVGNSVMEHILVGISPEPLGRIPFKPAFKEAKYLRAKDLGLDADDETTLYLFPLVGGFVGGDAVGVSLKLGFHSPTNPMLAIDIGTNSEIILSTPDGVFFSSAAAGPAFEGGEILCGMSAQKGAISKVAIEDDAVNLDVIGGVSPVGICGSGIVSALAELISKGVVEKNGRIKDQMEIPTSLSDRIRRETHRGTRSESGSDGGNSFILFRGASGDITITQSDIRALQAAKGAIRAGITIVLDRAGIAAENIEKVLIAGVFGSNLEKTWLNKIGLIEDVWLDRTNSIGDAALDGAILAISSTHYKKQAEKIALEANYVPLSGNKRFETEFIKSMDFN